MPPHGQEALDKRIRAVYDAFEDHNFKVATRAAATIANLARQPPSLPAAAARAAARRRRHPSRSRAPPPARHSPQAAIKLANAGLARYPDVPVLQSLKAVALVRTGKLDEALEVRPPGRCPRRRSSTTAGNGRRANRSSRLLRRLLPLTATPPPALRACLPPARQLTEALLAAAPPDDHVLNMTLLVLKPADRVADLLPAYEAALAKQPGNEELLHGLFACHARCGAPQCSRAGTGATLRHGR